MMSGEKRAADEPSWEFTVGLARGILMGGSFVFKRCGGWGGARVWEEGEGLGTDLLGNATVVGLTCNLAQEVPFRARRDANMLKSSKPQFQLDWSCIESLFVNFKGWHCELDAWSLEMQIRNAKCCSPATLCLDTENSL